MVVFSKLMGLNQEIINKILASSLKNFMIGASFTTLLTAFSFVQRFFKGKEKQEFSLKKFLIKMTETGTFLASWTFMTQIIIRIIDKNRERPKAQNLVISGAISGFLSMYFTQGISWQASLYFLFRSLFAVYSLKSSILPNWMNIPDYLAYCIINIPLGILSNSYVYYSFNSSVTLHTLIRVTWNFLLTVQTCQERKQFTCLEI
jgi:hypothetical protein